MRPSPAAFAGMPILSLVLIAALLAFFMPPLELFSAGREEAAAAAAEPRLKKKMAGTKLKIGNPVFLRLFKEESTLEVWLQPEGQEQFTLLHAYPICAWSGELGPKKITGDRQAPEGFYAVGTKHLNPFSSYHLSFDLGYPNAYDRGQGYSGSHLMIHGDCRSDGCFAMTDQGIEEIYTLVKAALDQGQPFFRVHSFPFHLRPENIRRHKNNAWSDFWLMLEPVYSYFEKHRQPPEVIVVKGSYKIAK